MEKLYSIAEMAKLLDMPESTVRYYRDRYTDFFPYTGTGRKKRYKQPAFEALRIIAELSKENKTAEEISDILITDFSKVIDIEIPNTDVEKELAITSAVTAAAGTQDYKNELATIANALSFIAEQDKRIKNLENEVAEMKELFKNQQAQEPQQGQSWLRRFFK